MGATSRRCGYGDRLQDQPPDPLHRIIIGRVYHYTVKMLFALRVRDVDCDFRLMRREVFDRVKLDRDSGVICLELMRKVQDAGFRVVEVPVHHYHRTHGRSQFFNFRRIFRTGVDVLKLWIEPWFSAAGGKARPSCSVIRWHSATAVRVHARGSIVTGSESEYQAFYRGRSVMITGGWASSEATSPGSWSTSAPASC